MINFIENNTLIDNVSNYDIILVATNIYATMNNGFAEDIRQRYPFVYEKNIQTKYGDKSLLGCIVEATQENQPIFGLCYIYTIKNKNKDTVNYDALEKILRLINNKYRGKRIGSTLLGSDRFEGNGDNNKIKTLFTEILTDVDIDVYLFTQDSHLSKWAKALKESTKIKDDKEKWEEYIKNSKKKITKIKNETTVKSHRRPFTSYSIRLNQR